MFSNLFVFKNKNNYCIINEKDKPIKLNLDIFKNDTIIDIVHYEKLIILLENRLIYADFNPENSNNVIITKIIELDRKLKKIIIVSEYYFIGQDNLLYKLGDNNELLLVFESEITYNHGAYFVSENKTYLIDTNIRQITDFPTKIVWEYKSKYAILLDDEGNYYYEGCGYMLSLFYFKSLIKNQKHIGDNLFKLEFSHKFTKLEIVSAITYFLDEGKLYKVLTYYPQVEVKEFRKDVKDIFTYCDALYIHVNSNEIKIM